MTGYVAHEHWVRTMFSKERTKVMEEKDSQLIGRKDGERERGLWERVGLLHPVCQQLRRPAACYRSTVLKTVKQVIGRCLCVILWAGEQKRREK